ncbi:MAG TPA: hypothetical protein VH681_14810 [Nitrospiraceae bacterium]|jgi:hypothetical protein
MFVEVRRKRLFLIAAVVALLATAFLLLPRHWHVFKSDGTPLCTVEQNWTAIEVAVACGSPQRQGVQPKVMSGWFDVCSAPCEVYGQHLVFYDCMVGWPRWNECPRVNIKDVC